jgi:hypothetical protein
MKPLILTIPKGFPLRLASGRVIALQEDAQLELKPCGAEEKKFGNVERGGEKKK